MHFAQSCSASSVPAPLPSAPYRRRSQMGTRYAGGWSPGRFIAVAALLLGLMPGSSASAEAAADLGARLPLSNRGELGERLEEEHRSGEEVMQVKLEVARAGRSERQAQPADHGEPLEVLGAGSSLRLEERRVDELARRLDVAERAIAAQGERIMQQDQELRQLRASLHEGRRAGPRVSSPPETALGRRLSEDSAVNTLSITGPTARRAPCPSRPTSPTAGASASGRTAS